jgi:hypothetical protein
MTFKLGITLLGSLILLATGCNSKSGGTVPQANAPQTASASASNPANVNGAASPSPTINSPASPPSGTGFVDACALIEKSEIASVQGAEVQSSTPSTQMNGALAISMCYYTVTSADSSKNLSVHLEVIKADPKSPNAVKEYWERAFEDKEGKGEKGEEEKESGPPQPVRGIGEEAFWMGNARVGALYALNKGKLVRVSIGGAYDPKTRLEKTKPLVANVLKRLS